MFATFPQHNMIDTCSIWNMISSSILYTKSKAAGIIYYATEFVIYECIHKPRKTATDTDIELMRRFSSMLKMNDFYRMKISIQDIQDFEKTYNTKGIGKGEMSCIILAQKYKQSIITDDQDARKIAENIIPREFVQTIPRLVGHLVFCGHIIDSDISDILDAHSAFNRNLEPHLTRCFHLALEQRLRALTP